MLHEKIYKIDTKGKIRVWFAESDSEKYRFHSGIDGGKIVISGWKYPTQKNVGKVNETSVEEQVLLEVKASYEKQLYQGGYSTTPTQEKKFFEPMLAGGYDENKIQFPVLSQPKLDGLRCIATVNGLWSRNGKPIVSCPHIEQALIPVFERNPNLVLDGEIYNHDLKNDFEKIISLARKTKPKPEDIEECAQFAQYHIYDCSEETAVLRQEERLEYLSHIHQHYVKNKSAIHLVETKKCNKKEELDNLYGTYLEYEYEGQMIRDPEAFYENRRTKSLLKRKEFIDDEYEIADILEGQGNWSGYCKSVVIRISDTETQESGVRGDQSFLKEVLENKQDYIGTDVTVRYQNKTAYGKLRFPVVVRFWQGKRDG